MSQSLARFDPYIQAQFPVDPVHPFAAPAKAIYVAQRQEIQTESSGQMVVGQANQPLRDRFALGIDLWLIPIAGLARRGHVD